MIKFSFFSPRLFYLKIIYDTAIIGRIPNVSALTKKDSSSVSARASLPLPSEKCIQEGRRRRPVQAQNQSHARHDIESISSDVNRLKKKKKRVSIKMRSAKEDGGDNNTSSENSSSVGADEVEEEEEEEDLDEYVKSIRGKQRRNTDFSQVKFVRCFVFANNFMQVHLNFRLYAKKFLTYLLGGTM